jgi:hypothetical protein
MRTFARVHKVSREAKPLSINVARFALGSFRDSLGEGQSTIKLGIMSDFLGSAIDASQRVHVSQKERIKDHNL